MTENNHHSYKIEKSALLTVIGVILLFSSAIFVVLIAPCYIDRSWTSPTTPYQVQVYEFSDPYIYISTSASKGTDLQFVRHLKQGFSLLAFKESDVVKIIAPKDFEKYITRSGDTELKLTTKILFLREPIGELVEEASTLKKVLQREWEEKNPNWKEKNLSKIDYEVLELYDPNLEEVFSISETESILENWVDRNYTVLDEANKLPFQVDLGVIYIHNPKEYRVSKSIIDSKVVWRYNPNGESVKNLEQLLSPSHGFRSRKELIALGEHIYAIEGCWYCHTDQTRTLVQDTVLNGSDSYPAPPSSANEYIYQKITFPGTRRIGPDLSRVGVKRPNRDWHKAHFWAPKTASAGSIMPAFQHFFDFDPRGTRKTSEIGIPNYRFEAIFQYLMTKGTRITPPTEAWWLGKDPIQTKEIIEGNKRLN